ncbi:MAG: Tetratricopeptide 2 repeat protein [Verrucomicrobia bacterium]|nr:Tetratricopeptide 2 repeat protein [Verrucomicrobiota bacterium]
MLNNPNPMRTVFFLFATVVAGAAVAPEKSAAIRELMGAKKLAAAESAAKEIAAAQPNDAEARALLASVLLAQGNTDGAVEALEAAVRLAPTSGDYQRQLGDAYGAAAQAAGMLSKMSLGKKALAAYERAVALNPRDLAARSSLMSFYQMAPAIMGGGMDKALAQAAAITEIDALRGQVARAILLVADKKYPAAFEHVDAVLQDSPNYYPALFQLGRIAALSGERVDAGIAALQRCLTQTPPAGSPGHDAAQWRLGLLWERKGDKDAARAAYRAALKVNPSFAQAIEALKKLG